MFRPRVIPVLLLKGEGLVKTKRFKNERYIGDPINAVRIFNDLKADELVFLDIMATKENRTISLDFVKEVGEEANMPFGVGGGVRTIENIKGIINAGAEKVIINSEALIRPEFIREAAETFGSSTIVICIDVFKNILGKIQVKSHSSVKHKFDDPCSFAKLMEEMGAGEIILQSVDRDGTMIGYDIELLKHIANAVSIPLVALGGSGSLDHLKEAIKKTNCSAVAAGSMFIYHGARNGILINYPNIFQKRSIIHE